MFKVAAQTAALTASNKPSKLLLNLSIRCQNLECVVDLPFRDTATNIQEVCWYTSVQLDQVHRCHCQSSTIDCTAATAITSTHAASVGLKVST